MKQKQNYTIEVRATFDAAIITRTYPARSIWDKPIQDILEVSCEIDRVNFVPKNGYKQDTPEWHYRLLHYAGDPLANWQGEEYAVRLIGQDAIEAAKVAICKSIKSLKGIIARGHKHPAYKAMKREADKTIKFYPDDFRFHDCIQLSGLDPSARFLWMVREAGTWLIQNKNDFAREIVKQETREHRHKIFVWTGEKLESIIPYDLTKVFDTLPMPPQPEKPVLQFA